MIKLAIIGYGKMGKLIHQLSEQYDIEVVSIIDSYIEKYDLEINKENLKGADICVDFTAPESAFENIKLVFKAGSKIVIGTTGWFDNLAEIEKICSLENQGIVYGSNFSVGMNMFYMITRFTAQCFNKIPQYDVFGLEKHHKHKVDSPSGTAKELSKIIVKEIDRKNVAVYECLDRAPFSVEFHFASVRGGSVPGTHEISFDSDADTISLTHTARNREGLAHGALMACQWLHDKQGCFDFKDIFEEMINARV